MKRKKPKKPENELKRFPLSAPPWVIRIIDEECERRGANREAYVREIIVKKADELRDARLNRPKTGK